MRLQSDVRSSAEYLVATSIETWSKLICDAPCRRHLRNEHAGGAGCRVASDSMSLALVAFQHVALQQRCHARSLHGDAVVGKHAGRT